MTSYTPTICLNMILKNESKIITRLLDSVVDLIDYYCICDTGSTDNTVEVIENYFKDKMVTGTIIPGKIIHEPFRDFGYNRSVALKACDDLSADYILLLDADMVLWRNPKFTPNTIKQLLVKDSYSIFQGSDCHYYKNTRIVKNHMGFKYWGVTHEYVDGPKGSSNDYFEKEVLFIKDIGDGGAKTDKFLRDINLLLKGLEEYPNNDRYTFYLANSYRDSGQYEKAIETYKKRIQIGGWIEEIWHSYYSIGKCWKELKNMDSAIAAWLDGYQLYPRRIENLFEIVHYYRNENKPQLAYMFYVFADKMRKMYPQRDYLFMHKDIYDFKLDFELSIFGYYCNLDNYDLIKVIMKVISDPNVSAYIIKNCMNNYKFYTEKLIDFDKTEWKHDSLNALLLTVGKKTLSEYEGYFLSTPSLCDLGDNRILVNARIVSYKINEKGGYDNQEKIHTINVLALIEQDPITLEWYKKREDVLKYNTEFDNIYVGLEDVRLFCKNGTVYYNANRGLARSNMVIQHGEINLDTFETQNDCFVEYESQNSVEKNWVLLPNSESNQSMIYGWSPLIIGETIESGVGTVLSFQKTNTHSTPPFFKNIRGSCNGINVTIDGINEIWYLCHAVSYEDRRYYYHIMVALDPETLKPTRYTPFFTFEKEKVEYTLGIIPFQNDLLIGYSIMDRETKYIRLTKEWFSSRMISI